MTNFFQTLRHIIFENLRLLFGGIYLSIIVKKKKNHFSEIYYFPILSDDNLTLNINISIIF